MRSTFPLQVRKCTLGVRTAFVLFCSVLLFDLVFYRLRPMMMWLIDVVMSAHTLSERCTTQGRIIIELLVSMKNTYHH